MTELKRCPIKGCTRSWKTKDGLGLHLYERHNKSEIIAALLDLLGV